MTTGPLSRRKDAGRLLESLIDGHGIAAALAVIGVVSLLAAHLGVRHDQARLLHSEVAADAARWNAIIRRSLPRLPEIMKTGLLSPAERETLAAASEAAAIVRYRIIGRDGMTFLGSRNEDIGKVVSGGDFDARVRYGESVTTVAVADGGAEGETVLGISMAPVRDGPAFVGAIEVTVDRTRRAAEIAQLRAGAYGWLALMFCLGAAAVFVFGLRTLRERDAARAALKEAEGRLEAVFENISGMVFRCRRSRHGRYSFPYVGEGASDLLGLDPRAVEREAALLFGRLAEDDRHGFDRALEDSAATLRPLVHEFRATHLDGTARWLRAAAKPVRDEGGAVLWEGVWLDLTGLGRDGHASPAPEAAPAPDPVPAEAD